VSCLPSLSGRDVAKALRKAGYEFDHREVAKGTLRAILRQAGLTVDEFRALL
jgi:predicted RNA binding protein YcfA (HicA-like mRNA interferase family)